MKGNPKNIYGIDNKNPHFLSIETPTVTCYHRCSNCGEKWETEFKAFYILGNMTSRTYDFCSLCKKDETPIPESHHTQCHWKNCPGDCFERYS